MSKKRTVEIDEDRVRRTTTVTEGPNGTWTHVEETQPDGIGGSHFGGTTRTVKDVRESGD